MKNRRYTEGNRKQLGSALVDYVLPTAVIALVVGVSIHQISSNGLLLNFFKNTMNMQFSASKGKAVLTGFGTNSPSAISEPGFFGGQPDNPVKICNGNNCTIDFGTVILHDIPENFGSYVETNGNAGGTEKLLAILKQLKAQLEENPDVPTDVITKIQGLLDRGYELVDIEKEFETFYGAANKTITNYNDFVESKKNGDIYFTTAAPRDVLLGANALNSITGHDYGKVTLKNGDSVYEVQANFNNIASLLHPTAVLEYQDGSFTGNAMDTGIVGNFNDYINRYETLANVSDPSKQALSPMGQFLDEVRQLNIEVKDQTNAEIASSVQLLTNLLSEEIFNLAQNVKSKTTEINYSTAEMEIVSRSIIDMLNSEQKNGLTSNIFQGLKESHSKLTTLEGSPATETDIDLHMICKSRGGEIDNKKCIEK
jgi:hypothetical protein